MATLKDVINNAGKDVKDVFMHRVCSTPNPKNEGKTHINLSVISKSWIGRFLAEGNMPFCIPELGEFDSINAFRLFITSKYPTDDLRYLDNRQAMKTLQRRNSTAKVKHYAELVKDAYRQILLSNPRIAKQLVETDLPFDLYYIRKTESGKPGVPVRPRDAIWRINVIEQLRNEFRNNTPAQRPSYDEILERIKGLVEEEVVEEDAVPAIATEAEITKEGDFVMRSTVSEDVVDKEVLQEAIAQTPEFESANTEETEERSIYGNAEAELTAAATATDEDGPGDGVTYLPTEDNSATSTNE